MLGDKNISRVVKSAYARSRVVQATIPDSLRTVDKGVDKGISRGPDPCPLDERITDRRARIRDKDRTRTGIDRVRAMQCFILSSRC